jgi:hypothetical protein
MTLLSAAFILPVVWGGFPAIVAFLPLPALFITYLFVLSGFMVESDTVKKDLAALLSGSISECPPAVGCKRTQDERNDQKPEE